MTTNAQRAIRIPVDWLPSVSGLALRTCGEVVWSSRALVMCGHLADRNYAYVTVTYGTVVCPWRRSRDTRSPPSQPSRRRLPGHDHGELGQLTDLPAYAIL